MTPRPFQQVDVFASEPLRGNPLAVVLDATGLDEVQMQRFTDWTNLSECTFVLPPSPEAASAGADYRVRIFCPGRELPFAGHPTLGTCHAWLRAGGKPQGDCVVQECGAGLLKIRRQGEWLAFAAPPLLRGGPLDETTLQRIAQGLGLAREDIVAHAWCDNGPHWRGVMLRSARQVLAVQPDPVVLAGMEVGLIGPHESGDAHFEVRAFFPVLRGIAEDPVTGSLNAALAQWLTGANLAPPAYLAAQGTALGRAGRVRIEREADGTIWVGGHSVTCIEGSVSL